ncbi:hypothetical protein JCM30471_17490 [Desulfuromonas carbonis]
MISSTLSKNLLAVCAGILLFLVLEGILALAGVPRLADEDRFVGFAGSTPLFIRTEPDATGANIKLNPAKGDYFNRQSFQMPKPEGTFRVISLGGSTTYGRPYTGETAFPRWLELLGNEYAGAGRFEVINAGGISYASYRVARLQQELIDYDPNLLVVYSGHNEFLEARTFDHLKHENLWLNRTRQLLHQSRLYSLLVSLLEGLSSKESSRTILPDEVSVELEGVVGPDFYHRDEDFRRGVLQQYRQSLQDMIDLAREKQVLLVLCTLPSNLSGVSPFKSEHRAGLTGSELEEFDRLFSQGSQALQQNEPARAMMAYRAALEFDDQFALLHYRLGQALLMSGLYDQAYASFVRAKQEDIIPLRALEEMNGIVRELAELNDVPLADVEATFRRVAPNGIPGADLFDDHVHPNIRGQQLVAWVVFDTLVKAQSFPLQIGAWQRMSSTARQLLLKYENAIPERYRALGLWGVGRLYFWAGKYPEAHVALKQAWAELKDIPEIPYKLGTLEVFRGNGAAALPYLNAARQMEPDDLNTSVMLANAYLLQKQAEKALDVLSGLPAGGDNSVGYLSVLGRARLQLGELKSGLDALKRAYDLNQNVPRSTREYAEGLAIAGQLPAAEKMFGRYLQLIQFPDPSKALQRWVKEKGWLTPREWLSRELGEK